MRREDKSIDVLDKDFCMPCGPSPRTYSTPARQCSLCHPNPMDKPGDEKKKKKREKEENQINNNKTSTGSLRIKYCPATCVREFVGDEES